MKVATSCWGRSTARSKPHARILASGTGIISVRRLFEPPIDARFQCVWNDDNEVGTMTASEVPMHNGMRTSSGTEN